MELILNYFSAEEEALLEVISRELKTYYLSYRQIEKLSELIISEYILDFESKRMSKFLKRFENLEEIRKSLHSLILAWLQFRQPEKFILPSFFTISNFSEVPISEEVFYVLDLDDTILDGAGLTAKPFPDALEFVEKVDFLIITARDVSSASATRKQLESCSFPLKGDILFTFHKAEILNLYLQKKNIIEKNYKAILFIDDNIINVLSVKNYLPSVMSIQKIQASEKK